MSWIPSHWTDAEIEYWKSLDHGFCSHIMLFNGQPLYETCRSTHCFECGQSTSSQGHLPCPVPVEKRKPWPRSSPSYESKEDPW